MKYSRRKFLVGCSAAVAAMAGSRVSNLIFAADSAAARRDIFVLIFLRGGCDGLNLVAPTDDRFYVAARSQETLVSDHGDAKGLPLKSGLGKVDFRLHPKAGALKELYDSNALAIVHACGLTNGTRSHFDAMDLIERGAADSKNKSLSSGWLARHLISIGAGGLLPAVGASSTIPDSLLASPHAVAVPDPGAFSLQTDERQRQILRELYKGNAPIHRAGSNTLHALDVVAKKLPRDDSGNPPPYTPDHQADYGGEGASTELATALQTVARFIKMDVGLQVATVDYGGWDTHVYQGGIFSGLVEGLSRGLGTFYRDLTNYQNRLTVLVMSEFGRRLKANESGGTDHGHGNVMLLLGGNVNGGRMFGSWPGLSTEQLDDQADLAVTTDYRMVLSEILVRRLANPKLGQVFPQIPNYKPIGIVRGTDLPVETGSSISG